MASLFARIIKNGPLLQAIRCTRGNDTQKKEDLQKICGVSWPTYKNAIQELLADPPLIIYDEATQKYLANPEIGYFLGISVGSKNLRVSLVDFAFQPVCADDFEAGFGIVVPQEPGIHAISDDAEGSSEELRYTTPATVGEIRNRIISIVTPFLNRHMENSSGTGETGRPFRLLGIGFAFPGAINYEEQRITASPIDGMDNLNLENIMGTDLYHTALAQHIYLTLDNNSKTSVIGEREYLFYPTCKDPKMLEELKSYSRVNSMAMIYVGTGLGCGVIQGNQLIRGSNNFTGEIGHIQIPNYPPDSAASEPIKCTRCKKLNCIEAIIQHESSSPVSIYETLTVTGLKDILAAHPQEQSPELDLYSTKINPGVCRMALESNKAKLLEELPFGKDNTDIDELYQSILNCSDDAFQPIFLRLKECIVEYVRETAKTKALLKHIPFLVNVCSAVLDVELIIISGHDVRSLKGFFSKIKDAGSDVMAPYTQKCCYLSQGRNNSNTAAIGAAIESYYCITSAPHDADYEPTGSLVNNAKNISWPQRF